MSNSIEITKMAHTTPNDRDPAKAIALLQKLKAERHLEVTVNRNGEVETTQVDVAPEKTSNP